MNVFEWGFVLGEMTKKDFRAVLGAAREESGEEAGSEAIARKLNYETAEDFLADLQVRGITLAEKKSARAARVRAPAKKLSKEELEASVKASVAELGAGADLKSVAARAHFRTLDEFLRAAREASLDVFRMGVLRGELSAGEIVRLARAAIADLGETAAIGAVAMWQGYRSAGEFLKDAWGKEIDVARLNIPVNRCRARSTRSSSSICAPAWEKLRC